MVVPACVRRVIFTAFLPPWAHLQVMKFVQVNMPVPHAGRLHAPAE